MEILVGLTFIGIVGFVAYRKFRRATKGKDCCK
jgi:hypothetical protein